ncbi:MAG: S8 family serine peptidase, partial [Candidatus Binatia bacterium]
HTPAEAMGAALPMLRLRGDAVAVDVRFRTLTDDVIAQARRLGLEIEHASRRYGRLAGWIAPAGLAALAALPEVTVVHPLYGAATAAGSVVSQADASIGADTARATFAVDGSGTRVGIVSDSFHLRRGGTVQGSGCDAVLSGSVSQASGDLPSAVTMLDNGPAGGSDEGTAMAELIHDLAPGAELLFHSGFPDEAACAEGITALRACGSDILVDDLIFFAEPMFQDGIIAQAADAAVADGAAYFAAAGNTGGSGIDAAYRDALTEDDEDEALSGNDLHDFGAGDRFAAITIPNGCGVRLVLQWNEPFSAPLGDGASTDLDLYLLDAEQPDASVVTSSVSTQGCASTEGAASGDPLELVAYRNGTGAPRTVYVAIDHFCGTEDLRFRLAVFRFGCGLTAPLAFEPGLFESAQIYGHAAAAGVAAVGAVFYAEIDSGGEATPPSGPQLDVEPFSARGGALPIYFDAAGAPLAGAPLLRVKPELAAPDGTNTTFFGVDSPFDEDTHPNFFGTSAAAPHAAAVAALMRSANPGLDSPTLLALLRATAQDVAEPGPDSFAGDGLIDAAAAVAAAAQAVPTHTPTATPPPTATPTATASATASTTPPPALAGDCNRDGSVSIAELIAAVRIALGTAPASRCAAADANGDSAVSITELVGAVAAALR